MMMIILCDATCSVFPPVSYGWTVLVIFFPFLLNAEDSSLLVSCIISDTVRTPTSITFSQNAFVFVCFNKMWSTQMLCVIYFFPQRHCVLLINGWKCRHIINIWTCISSSEHEGQNIKQILYTVRAMYIWQTSKFENVRVFNLLHE